MTSWGEYDHIVFHITRGSIEHLGRCYLARYHLGLQRISLVAARVVARRRNITLLAANRDSLSWGTDLPGVAIHASEGVAPAGPYMVSLLSYAAFLIRARTVSHHPLDHIL